MTQFDCPYCLLSDKSPKFNPKEVYDVHYNEDDSHIQQNNLGFFL